MKRTMLTRVQQLLGRVHRDEGGTALTEFVICLPAFITVFIAVHRFSQVQTASVAVHVTAAKRLWTAAIPVQKSKNKTDHMQPTIASVKAIQIINKRSSGGMVAKAQDLAAMGGLAAGGHIGEAYARTLLYDTAGFANYPTDPKMTGNQVVNTKIAKALINDNISAPSGGGGAVGALASAFLGSSGMRAALGAGIRYGMVSGTHSQNVSVPGWNSVGTSAFYDTLVSPYPHSSGGDHAQTIAISRVTLEESKNYSTVLSIESSNKFKTE